MGRGSTPGSKYSAGAGTGTVSSSQRRRSRPKDPSDATSKDTSQARPRDVGFDMPIETFLAGVEGSNRALDAGIKMRHLWSYAFPYEALAPPSVEELGLPEWCKEALDTGTGPTMPSTPPQEQSS